MAKAKRAATPPDLTTPAATRPVKPTRRVRATKRGYYDGLREPGAVFLVRTPYLEQREVEVKDERGRVVRVEDRTVTVDEFSTIWMEDDDGTAPIVPTPLAAAKAVETDESNPLSAD